VSGPAPAGVELSADGWEADVLAREEPILVDFWAPGCAPCVKVAPAVEALGRRYAGRMTVGTLNVDEHPRAAERYDVLSIPTLILFKGGAPVARVVGAARAGRIERALTPHLEA